MHVPHVSASLLTRTVRTPPVHHTDRLGRTLWAGSVVLRGVFMHGKVDRAVQRDKRELRQVDRMFLVEDLLARCRVCSCLLLYEETVQLMVGVEGNGEPSRWDLVTREQRGV